MPDIVLRNFPFAEYLRGAKVARQFLEEHPERMGRESSVVYGQDVEPFKPEMVAYRTKTSVVVRWLEED